MKETIFILLFIIPGMITITAQNDYIVKTFQQTDSNMSEEERFVESNFPLITLCKWTPGLKFMFIPDGNDLFVPIFNSYETGKEADSSKLKHRFFEFQGIEEKAKETHVGTNYSTVLSLAVKGINTIMNLRGRDLMTFVSGILMPVLTDWYIYLT